MNTLARAVLAGFLGVMAKVFTEAADYTDNLSWQFRQEVRKGK